MTRHGLFAAWLVCSVAAPASAAPLYPLIQVQTSQGVRGFFILNQRLEYAADPNSPWVDVGLAQGVTPIDGGLSAQYWGGKTYVWMTGTDGNLYTYWFNGGAWAWQEFVPGLNCGSAIGSPSAAGRDSGYLGVAVRCQTNRMGELYWDAMMGVWSWRFWAAPENGQLNLLQGSDPSFASGPGSLTVAVDGIGPDAHTIWLLQIQSDHTGASWTGLFNPNGSFAARPALYAPPSGLLGGVVASSDGIPWRFDYTSFGWTWAQLPDANNCLPGLVGPTPVSAAWDDNSAVNFTVVCNDGTVGWGGINGTSSFLVAFASFNELTTYPSMAQVSSTRDTIFFDYGSLTHGTTAPAIAEYDTDAGAYILWQLP